MLKKLFNTAFLSNMQRILRGVRLLSKLLHYITKRYMRKGYNVMGTPTQRKALETGKCYPDCTRPCTNEVNRAHVRK